MKKRQERDQSDWERKDRKRDNIPLVPLHGEAKEADRVRLIPKRGKGREPDRIRLTGKRRPRRRD